jgi:hypothetical protein
MKKQTSPVKGYALKNTTMTVNHTLHKLIHDWSPKTTVPTVSSSVATARLSAAIAAGKATSTTAQKRPHAAEEDDDLFGSDSDDGEGGRMIDQIYTLQSSVAKETAAVQMAPSGAGRSGVSATAPTPKRMKKAMKKLIRL